MPIVPQPPLPPPTGTDGKDLYPFSITERGSTTRYGWWFDAVADAEFRNANRPVSRQVAIEGVEPSHDMEPWQSMSACSVCGVADGTIGAVLPCGLDLGGQTLGEAARRARFLVG